MILLDGLTLLVAGWFVASLAAIVLLAAWTQMRQTTALLWWAASHAINSAGAGAFAFGIATLDPLTATLAGGAIAASMAGYWAGTRVFFERTPSAWVIGSATVVWVASAIPAIGGGPRASVAMAFVLTTIFLLLACRELWRENAQDLRARWPLMTVFALHASFMAAGVAGIATGNVVADATPSLFEWIGLVHFERLVFLLGTVIFMVVIARERRELTSMAAARFDSLTGVANRGAFFAQADRLFRRARENGDPVSLIAFDLDHFKSVNDNHGHAVGDRVLKSFAETAAAVLRPSDLFGRVGGEEFAALLPGASPEAAFVIADRVRHAFSVAPKAFGNAVVHATVSAGVAAAAAAGSLEGMMEAADHALYRAKAAGRNRVERAEAWTAPGRSKVIRVA